MGELNNLRIINNANLSRHFTIAQTNHLDSDGILIEKMLPSLFAQFLIFAI